LIPVLRTRREGLVEHALVDQAGIEQAVEHALALTASERATMGEAARRFFLDNDRAFRQRLPAACMS